MNNVYAFKKENNLEKRKSEASRIAIKYPTRIPIIVEVHNKDAEKISLDKTKYLVPFELTVGQFLFIIRKRTKVEKNEAMFLFFNGKLIPVSSVLGSTYKEYRDIDGFLYATMALENAFG
jgi:GABA(A) receptor-associated protein